MAMNKVVGIGIFIRAKDTKILREWYLENLEIDFHPDYLFTTFAPSDMAVVKNSAQMLSLLDENSQYFEPSKSGFMLNLCVNNIAYFVEKLKANNVEILWQDLESEHGKFVHILDIEGNKIELWQPV